jgi:diaminopimelate epimerase
MQFTKAHGTGNDFVVLIDLEDEIDLTDHAVRELCDRHTGVGADGVIRIGAPRDGGDAFMDYRNADGSVVEMCGNGVRVVAKIVVDRGLVMPWEDVIEVDTRAGIKPVRIARGDDGHVSTVTVDMGPPSADPAVIPTTAPTPDEFTLDGVEGFVWSSRGMGNPHAITLVDDVVTAPVDDVGPVVETHAVFPKGTNVEFARVIDRGHVDLRVWERGVGETQACGTGACATVALVHDRGLVDDDVAVRVPGGILTVRYRPDEHPSVFMTGPAEEILRGELSRAWLTRRGIELP